MSNIAYNKKTTLIASNGKKILFKTDKPEYQYLVKESFTWLTK